MRGYGYYTFPVSRVTDTFLTGSSSVLLVPFTDPFFVGFSPDLLAAALDGEDDCCSCCCCCCFACMIFIISICCCNCFCCCSNANIAGVFSFSGEAVMRAAACRGEGSLVDDGLAVGGGLATGGTGEFCDDCLTRVPSGLPSSSKSNPCECVRSRFITIKALCTYNL